MNRRTLYFSKHAPAYNSSKEDEMNFLRDLEGSLNPNTYIASLINGNLLDWFFMQVKNDHSCDLVHSYEYYKQRSEALEADLKVANATIVSKANEYNSEILHLGEIITSNADLLNDKNETIKALSSKLEEAQEASYQESYDREHDRQDFENEIASLKEQIRTLKCRLYDIEHPTL